jgi:hypothetical protein
MTCMRHRGDPRIPAVRARSCLWQCCVTAALLALLSVPAAQGEEVVAPLERETVAIPSGLEAWHLDWHGAVVEAHTLEWVTGAETVRNWTQLFTVQRMILPPDVGAEQFATLLLESLRHRCPGLASTILEASHDSALYEWRIAGCKGADDQHELVRVIRSADYVFRLAYTRKGPALEADARQRWLGVVGQAHLLRCCEAEDRGLSMIPLVRVLESFRFNELPGMKLGFVPVDDPAGGGGFGIVSSGFPADHRYDVFTVYASTAETIPLGRALVADEQGRLRCATGPAAPVAPGDNDFCRSIGDIEQLHFGYGDLQKGMPLVIAARSTDGAHATYAKVVPKPLEGREGPCHVTLELVSTDARTYVAYGDGFPPGEVVSLAWNYGGHTAAHTARTDSTGAFAAAINHEGQPAGRHKWDARLEAVASSCRPAVAYLWGEAGMKP